MPALFRLLRIAAALALLTWLPAAQAADCAIGAAGATIRVMTPGGRALLLHVPSGFDSARPAPIVFLFHGSTGSGAAALADSKLAATADRHGFILAAPDGGIRAGAGYVWNIPNVPSTSGRMPDARDPDDVAFVARTIDWLAGARCIDPTRVYATGISGGGRMTSLLGCVAADRFAAIAPVVGLRAGNPLRGDSARPDPTTCRPARPMPVMAFAGDKDTTNPIKGGGAPYWQYPMRAAEQRWAALNGCIVMPPRRFVTKTIYEDSFTRCRAGADVIARITVGGTHVWLADNEAMWAFFARHRRSG